MNQDDGLVDLLWCGGHVVTRGQAVPRQPLMPESAAVHAQHQAAPWFQYPVTDDAEKDLFAKIFGEMAAATVGPDTTPPRGGKAGNSMSGHHASTTVQPSGKRERSDISQSLREVMLGVDESAATRCKRRRAAQEHNLSERRRRDRINEKMRALQELVPHCNKTDRASMLDEAIEYLKSLQLQVQVMSTTAGGMAPVMFSASGAHQYMRRMASRIPPFRT
ncbi:unnamed protein product [Alopecurus aequalis]